MARETRSGKKEGDDHMNSRKGKPKREDNDRAYSKRSERVEG